MSADMFYRFPFGRWQRDQVQEAVAKLREHVGSSFTLDVEEIDPREGDGSFDVVFVGGERAGRLYLRSGGDDVPAYIRLELDTLDDASADAADDLAMGFCDLLDGRPEEENAPPTDVEASSFASWSDLKDYVVERYRADSPSDEGEAVYVTWSWSDTERTQLVRLLPVAILEEQWVVLQSPVARVAGARAEQVLERASSAIAAVVRNDEEYVLSATLPLDALSAARLDAVLDELAQDAASMEEALLGSDNL